MTSTRSRLRASLLAVVTPVLACGGSTTEGTSPAATAGAGGGSAGSSIGGKAGANSAGASSGGSSGAGGSTAGSAGKAAGGSAGATAGSSGAGGSTAGSAGKAAGGGAGASAGTGGAGGSTAGSAGKAAGGSAGKAAGGSAGKAAGGSAGKAAGGSAGASAGSAGTAGSGGSFAYVCANPTPILVDGKDTGYDTCDAGQTRRREKLDCPTTVPRAATCDSGIPQADTCKQDSDCAAQPNGYCNASSGFGPGGCHCQYGCVTDADCGSGSICVCGDPIGACRPATCTSAADCGFGDCSSYDTSMGCNMLSFVCQTPNDTCGGDGDCANSGPATHCGFATDSSGNPAESRSCLPGGCAIGRPLFVEEQVRTAELARRLDWAA